MAQALLDPPIPSLEDPEPEPPPPAPARRRASAPRVLLSILVCLGLWAVLFSPVLELNARTSPVGARRTVALAVLRPLSAFARAVSVGHAADVAMRALGREPGEAPGGELVLPELDLPPLPSVSPAEVAVSVDATAVDASPTGTPAAARDGSDHPSRMRDRDETDRDRRGDDDRRAAIPPIRVPTARDELRVAVVGDSLSQGLGPAVTALFEPDVTRVVALGRQSTGLARQDYFNWRAAMRTVAERFRPDVVFVMLGSNDQQAQISPDGAAIRVGSEAWVRGYRERAAAFLAEATSVGTRVVWVGVPVVADRGRWGFYRRLNAIYEDVARADPLATYVDAWGLFQARDGGYTAYLRDAQGDLRQMRAGDGVHFTPTGYSYLARTAIRAAGEAFALPQVAVRFRI